MRSTTLVPTLFFLALPVAAAAGQVPYDSQQPGILSDVVIHGSSSGMSGNGGLLGPGRGWTWHTLAAPSWKRSRCGAVSIDKDLLLIGGETPTGLRAAYVERWDRGTQTWSTSAVAMPRPVSNIMGSCVLDNGLVYVFGGLESGDVPVDTVQIYDPVADTWSVHPTPMPYARLGVGASSLGGGRILVCGGADLLYAYDDSWIFDVATGTFTPGPPMVQADFNISITHEPNPVDGRVYMTGLFTDTWMQVYDTATGAFLAGPLFTTGQTSSRAGCGIINVGGHVIVYGGDWLNYRSDAEVFACGSGATTCKILQGVLMNTPRRTFGYASTPCPGAFAGDGFNGTYLADVEGAR